MRLPTTSLRFLLLMLTQLPLHLQAAPIAMTLAHPEQMLFYGESQSVQLRIRNTSKDYLLLFERDTCLAYGDYHARAEHIFLDAGVQKEDSLHLYRVLAPSQASDYSVVVTPLSSPIGTSVSHHVEIAALLVRDKTDVRNLYVLPGGISAFDPCVTLSANDYMPWVRARSLKDLRVQNNVVVVDPSKLCTVTSEAEFTFRAEDRMGLRSLYERWQWRTVQILKRRADLGLTLVVADGSTYLLHAEASLQVHHADPAFFELLKPETDVLLQSVGGCFDAFESVDLLATAPFDDQRYHGHARYRVRVAHPDLWRFLQCVAEMKRAVRAEDGSIIIANHSP